MFRYRLSNSPKNKDLHSRNLSNKVLYKNRWLYSEEPLFRKDQYTDIVIQEEAKDKAEFLQKDEIRRKRLLAKQKAQAKKKKEPLTPKKKEPDFEYGPEDIDAYPESGLKELAFQFGIDEGTIEDSSLRMIREYLKLDLSICDPTIK